MSGYESVARQLETVAKIRAAANAGSKLRNKQRKWKIYFSICLLLPALAAIIGIVAWAISIEVASTNSKNLNSISNSHHNHNHKNNQHHMKTSQPQSLVFHQFKRHQPPLETVVVESSMLGPKGVELSDTRGIKPVAAAVISSFAKSRKFANKDNNQAATSSANKEETIIDSNNRSSQSSSSRIRSVVANSIIQNKNQKRSDDNGWPENNKSESVNSDNMNSNSNNINNNSNNSNNNNNSDNNNNSNNNNNDDDDSDDDNEQSNTNSATSSSVLIKNEPKETSPSTTSTPKTTTSTSTSKPTTTTTTTTTTTSAPTSTTTTTTTQAPPSTSTTQKSDTDITVSTSERSPIDDKSNQRDSDEMSREDDSFSSMSVPSVSMSSSIIDEKTRTSIKSSQHNRMNDRMMMMMAAAIMPSDENKSGRKLPWFNGGGYMNERKALKFNPNGEHLEGAKKEPSQHQHQRQYQHQRQLQSQIQTQINHQDNPDGNVDCEQQKVIEEQEYENHQATDALKHHLSVEQDDDNKASAIKPTNGVKQNSRYNIIQDNVSGNSNEPSATTDSSFSDDLEGEKEKEKEKEIRSSDNGQMASLSTESNSESESSSSSSLSSKQEDNPDKLSSGISYETGSGGNGDDENDESKSPLDTSSGDKSINSGDNSEQNDDISFQAIANAISTSLSANSAGDSSPSSQPSSTDGDTDNVSSTTDQSSGNGKSSVDQDTIKGSSTSINKATLTNEELRNKYSRYGSSRQRTTGEHLAEVIDHIVERRKQANINHASIQRGPQIVVVAPIEDGMKARSLTKVSAGNENNNSTAKQQQENQQQASGATSELKKKNVDEKRNLSSIKKEAHIMASSSGNKDKQVASGGKYKKPTRIIGARLLGIDALNSTSSSVDSTKQPPIRYSERVEVIEDDDSSALLFKNLPDQGKSSESSEDVDDKDISRIDKENQREIDDDSLLLPLDYQSSIHVSSRPGEARSRSARHELNPNLAFERYAQLKPQQEPLTARGKQVATAANNAQAKLYSAEQLIRDHVLKSKLLPIKQKAQQVINNGEEQQQENQAERIDNRLSGISYQAQPNINNSNNNQPKQLDMLNYSQHQVKVRPTTIKPQTSSMQSISTTTQTPIQIQTTMTSVSTESSPSVSLNQAQQQQMQLQSRQRQQANYDNAEINQALASNRVQSVQIPVFMQSNQQFAKQQQAREEMQMKQNVEMFQAKESQPQIVNYQEQPQPQQPQQQQQPQQFQQKYLSSDQQQLHQNQQQKPSLPLFADQEYNVPAHMAESVIHDIQQTSATISMVNGQPTIVNLPARQNTFNQNPNNQVMYPDASQMNQQQQQMMYQNMPPQHGYLGSQQQYPMADSWNRFQDFQRLQQLQQQQQQQQRQVLANRNGLETSQTAASQASPSPVSVSLRTPKGLIHPVAQMALKHLLNSFRDQPLQQRGISEPVSAMASPSQPSQGDNQESASIAQPAVVSSAAAAASAALPKLYPNGGDQMQVEGSNLAPIRVGANTDASTGRQMRSLPIGAAASSVIPQQQLLTSSQEMSESYSNMPTYHMGGGEGGYHYGGNNYESDHDKKSKGITFHFGGGPIGGGTQLITSPMGIFKHLMIPLLPNPRINLNGKVVFGVVLEKSTAIGPPPKKKYKFWGR